MKTDHECRSFILNPETMVFSHPRATSYDGWLSRNCILPISMNLITTSWLAVPHREPLLEWWELAATLLPEAKLFRLLNYENLASGKRWKSVHLVRWFSLSVEPSFLVCLPEGIIKKIAFFGTFLVVAISHELLNG